MTKKKWNIATFHFFISFLLLLIFSGCASTFKPNEEKENEAVFSRKMGMALFVEKQYQRAYVEFQKAIELNDRDKESFYYIGYIYTLWGQYENAIKFLKKAISLDKHYAEAYNHLGVVYLNLQKWDKALESFHKAIREPLYETPEMAYYNAGRAYYYRGDYLKAIDSLQNSLTRSPDFARANYFMGLIHLKLGGDENAKQEFLIAIEKYPDYVEAHWNLAKLYLEKGERRKSFFHFKKVATITKDDNLKKDALRYLELIQVN